MVLKGNALLPIALNYIPALLASHDWMQRHAGLMAIASVAEGTRQAMEQKLEQIVWYACSPGAFNSPYVCSAVLSLPRFGTLIRESGMRHVNACKCG
jgi:uncharacterized membrane protein YdcZ (DUF606 family)